MIRTSIPREPLLLFLEKYLRAKGFPIFDRWYPKHPFGIGDDDMGTRYTRCKDNVIDGYVEVPASKYEVFSYEFMVEVLIYSLDIRTTHI